MSEVAEEIRLVPYRSIPIRLTVFVLLIALVLIGLPPWYEVVSFAVGMALLVGTFPRALIRDGQFEREFRLAFFRIHHKRWRLDKVEHLETGLEEKLAWTWGFLIGFQTVFFGKIFDRLLPWLGGDYKIWLRTFGDRRGLAWQGNGETQFRANLEALETATGRTATLRSDYDAVTPAQLLEILEELPGGRFLKKIPLAKRFFGRRDDPRRGKGRDA